MNTCKNCGVKIKNVYLVTRDEEKVMACFDCAEIKNWENYQPKYISKEQLAKVIAILDEQKESADEVCEDCDNGTDMPCKACLDEDMKKGLGIK